MQPLSYYTDFLGFSEQNVQALYKRINSLAKPLGSLGLLEDTALQLGLIFQNTPGNKIKLKPHALIFAGDHGLNIKHQTSSVPSELTTALINNALQEGAGITSFCNALDFSYTLIDAGVLQPQFIGKVINRAIRCGTNDFSTEDAMSIAEAQAAIEQGRKAVHEDCAAFTNVLVLGEIGIGNTASASAIMSKIMNISPVLTTGRGSGIDDVRLQHKKELIKKGLTRHSEPLSPIEILAAYGGFEIAEMVGAILEGAKCNMAVVIDGFMVTAAAMLAYAIKPDIRGHLIFAHESNEGAHHMMLEYLGATPLLKLNLRLGEGTGAALAVPLLKAAAGFLNDMAYFNEAGELVKE